MKWEHSPKLHMSLLIKESCLLNPHRVRNTLCIWCVSRSVVECIASVIRTKPTPHPEFSIIVRHRRATESQQSRNILPSVRWYNHSRCNRRWKMVASSLVEHHECVLTNCVLAPQFQPRECGDRPRGLKWPLLWNQWLHFTVPRCRYGLIYELRALPRKRDIQNSNKNNKDTK
jgi:hypothetical protein